MPRSHHQAIGRSNGAASSLLGRFSADFIVNTAGRSLRLAQVEQKLTIALKISRCFHVMGHGRIVFEGTPAELAANAALRKNGSKSEVTVP